MINSKSIKEISDIISNLEKPEVEKFLKELLTQSELSDISQRWNILKLLKDQQSQRAVTKKLSVSLCKVTRGAKILKNEKSIIRKILFDESWQS